MFKLFGNKKLILLLLGLIFFTALMGISSIEKRDNFIWPEKFLKDSVSWMQGLIYRPAGYIAGFFENIVDLKVIHEENKALKLTLSQYARDRAKLNRLEEENERLMEELQFTEEQKKINDYKFHIAHVVSINPDAFNDTITINLGSEHGMELNMLVTTTDGLIGRISEVTPLNATVQLLTDFNDQFNNSIGISATVLGSEESFGIIQSYDEKENVLIMSQINQNDILKEGDVIITSGLGKLFPEGIEVGTVLSREVGDFGLTHIAKIKPAAKFENLMEVFVVEKPGM
ncbi:rod shape-determining protein MreC [Chengkuizengella axinellae]|uniref:Cell shape-determining protein MreC n=1 Tax=Chengkuizengella axinellae TaxID=3064388 RepID=A0ABT9ITU8_9BACL|nr:rod shape-determining protein MreC [Chengkuizengella sp. 2205SS18-9]MDP5272728.1 rod shape-determining protein MreC [Chengkuizengella sp. 2205SS18-9]